jgi:signal peptidase II
VETKAHVDTSGAAALSVAPSGRLVCLLVAAGVFVADRLTKILIESTFPLYSARSVVPGFFQIVHVTNEGMAFGLFNDSPSTLKTTLLIVASAVALAAVIYMLWTSAPGSRLQPAALSLILGGAAGNLFDRVRQGRVVDFLDFYVGDVHWPAFNLADSAIVIGGGLLLLYLARHPRPHR